MRFIPNSAGRMPWFRYPLSQTETLPGDGIPDGDMHETPYIGRLELITMAPKLSTLRKLAKALGVPVARLVG